MSKKVICIALVVLMLFSMAMPSYALADGKYVGFTVSASATTVNPGQDVEIIVSLQGDADHLVWGGGVIPLAYDKDLITEPAVIADDVLEYGDFKEFVTFAEGYGASVDTGLSTVEPIPYDDFDERDEDTNKGWDALTTVAVVDNGDFYTLSAAETDNELFRYKFTVSENAKPGDKIYVGMPIGAFDGKKPISYIYSDDVGRDVTHYKHGEVYDFTNATVELTVASAAEPTVEFAGTMGQMADWSTKTGPFNGGLVGKISGMDLTFPNGECAEISAIKVTIKTENGEETKQAYQVYKQEDGSYLFRAVIKGMEIDSTKTFQYKFTVERPNADPIETKFSDPISAKDIYTTALDNYNKAVNA